MHKTKSWRTLPEISLTITELPEKGKSEISQKVDAVWHEAQAAYIQDVKDIPLIDPRIRIEATAEVYEKLYREFEAISEG